MEATTSIWHWHLWPRLQDPRSVTHDKCCKVGPKNCRVLKGPGVEPRGGGVPGEPEGFRLGRLGNLRDLNIREDSGNHPLSLRILY